MGKRLELPSGGIFPERYSSIVAETQEQLDSFGLGLQDVGIIGRVRGGARQVWTGSKFAPCHSREVDELPADASTYGPLVLYQKYPTVASLPATVVDGQSWVVGGVEYLGRNVVELSSDTITWLPSVANHKTQNSITLQIKDVISGTSSSGDIINAMRAGGSLPCWWLYHASNTVVFVLRDTVSGDFQGSAEIPSLFDGHLHEFKIEFSESYAKLIVDGDTKISISLDGKTLFDCESIRMQDGSVGIRPLQISCIQQSLNGTLIDNIPCDDETGTTLANTVTPSRPATLNDATAHALAWVPQPSVTKAVYRYQKIARFTAQTQKVYVETRLFDQNLDFDIEF